MTCGAKPDMLLWLDVETTALDPTRGQLLEVGMAVTGMDGETPDDVDDRLIRTWVIEHDAIRLCPDTAWAVDVHTRNGLVGETFGDDAVGAYTAAKQINGVLTDWAGKYTLHPAGTNVDFDIKWIRSRLELHLDMLHYRKLDLTALRFLMRQVTLGAYFEPSTDHRVTTCLNRDIKEYKHILDKITALAEKEPK